MIHWRDVVVCYEPDNRHPVNALDKVWLQVATGEWVFFVGPSGAGKSTLLKLVYGGAHAHRGHIEVDGQDVTRLAAREIPLLRRKIGVVFQDFQLLAQKTVWENVAFALQVIGAPQKRLVRDVPRALETVGLSHKADARPHELSGGEAQRVAIARAIVNDPLILIADEPTGNLDPQTASDIAQVLRLINKRGTTILMATHDRALVDEMKNRVVRIAQGRVVSDQAQGEYHPEDDVLPLAANAPGAASDAVSNAASNASSLSVAPVSSTASTIANSNGAPLNTATNTATRAAPSNPKVPQPVSAFTGQVGASLVANAPLADSSPRMSTHVANAPLANAPLANAPAAALPDSVSSVPDVQSSAAPSSNAQAVTTPAPSNAIATPSATASNPVASNVANQVQKTPPVSAPKIASDLPASTSAASTSAASTSAASIPSPSASPSATAPQASSAIAPTRAAGSDEGAFHDSIDRARLNQAPIGSPENPIIQLERAPEVQMPHEVEA